MLAPSPVFARKLAREFGRAALSFFSFAMALFDIPMRSLIPSAAEMNYKMHRVNGELTYATKCRDKAQ